MHQIWYLIFWERFSELLIFWFWLHFFLKNRKSWKLNGLNGLKWFRYQYLIDSWRILWAEKVIGPVLIRSSHRELASKFFSCLFWQGRGVRIHIFSEGDQIHTWNGHQSRKQRYSWGHRAKGGGHQTPQGLKFLTHKTPHLLATKASKVLKNRFFFRKMFLKTKIRN